MNIGQKVKLIDPRVEGDVRGVIARERKLSEGAVGYIVEVTEHNGAPFSEEANPFHGPFEAEQLEMVD